VGAEGASNMLMKLTPGYAFGILTERQTVSKNDVKKNKYRNIVSGTNKKRMRI